MERRDARLFQHDADTHESWNIVELESHRQLRQKTNELIQLANTTRITTSDMQQRLHLCTHLFGNRFATQLVRSLSRDDTQERQSVVWLLTLLNDKNTIPPLQLLSCNERLPRSIRLAASLALAGMGATKEVTKDHKRVRMYAIS